jgi:cytochrome c biogenesis protein CcmG, thiol:disulfide interchange protein DsbE
MSDVDVATVPARRHTARWAAVTIGVVVLLLIAVLATRKSAADKQALSPLLGHRAPALSGPSILDGKNVSLDGLRGKWVLVNFLASWCVPCAEEHPELVKFIQRHRAAGDAQVLGVVFDDTAGNVRGFFKRLGGSWPVLDDPGDHVALEYGVRGPPESFLIDPNGFAVSKIVGQVTADGLEKLLARAKARGA